MEGARILVVEDEPGIVDFLLRGLAAEGFQVEAALDGVQGAEQALAGEVDLVVLDMMLPGRSGQEVLAEVHGARPQLPVIVLTARGEVEDRVSGLEAGAVDYLVKPFSLAELVARIRAQLRVAAQAPRTWLSEGGVTMDLISREVQAQGQPIRLSATEFDLLAHLMRNAGRVVGRTEILRSVWGYDHDPGTNVVDVYIGYLRRKLAQPAGHTPIATVRNAGYRFDVGE